VWINTGRLGYSLRGRRGLSARVGNTTMKRVILEERKQFRQYRSALQPKVCTSFSFKIHLFLQNVLQNLVRSTSESVTSRCFCYFMLLIITCLRRFAIRFIVVVASIIVAAFIFRYPFGTSRDCYMRTEF
jgi:small-conductance mechanosensitive channel